MRLHDDEARMRGPRSQAPSSGDTTERQLFNHQTAVDNTRALFHAAARAGVQRIVHVSIANPRADSPLPYFSGKAELERALRESGVAHSILRPAVLFGPEDILINNIA